MKTIIDILKLSTDFLIQKKISQPRRQAEDIIADALKIDRVQLYMQHDRPLTDPELELCRSRLARRAKGEPLQYIRGEVDFLDCRIKVTPAALIPRQETEILADKIVKELATIELKGKSLWDVCCGTGCIGIAIKKKFPDLNVVLSDVSPEALQLAKENAQLNEVDVEFYEGDFLHPFTGKTTDFFVCNPPYVADHEFAHLDDEVKNHEPKLALLAGPDGLDFYKKLAQELPNYLRHGKAWLEIGKDQGKALIELFSKGPWTQCRVEKDWAGNDRFLFLES